MYGCAMRKMLNIPVGNLINACILNDVGGKINAKKRK